MPAATSTRAENKNMQAGTPDYQVTSKTDTAAKKTEKKTCHVAVGKLFEAWKPRVSSHSPTKKSQNKAT